MSPHERKNLNGFHSLERPRRHEEAGAPDLARRERVLTALLEAWRQHLGRELDVLALGQGVEPHAAALSRLPGTRYHTQALSELTPTQERRFDVVLTISALVHQPPELLPGLMETLTRVTRPGGFVCLVENELVPFSLVEDALAPGRWLHAYADVLPAGWELHLGTAWVEGQAVYLLRRAEGTAGRVFRLEDLALPPAQSQALSRSELHELGLPRMRDWALARQSAPAPEARVQELEQLLTAERAHTERRQRLLSLADELARMRTPETSRPAPKPPTHETREPTVLTQGVLIDDALDTRWAYQEPRLEGCTHIFHQEWSGIRAAAGFLPGHKIAITADRPLSLSEHRQIIDACADGRTRTVIFQGYSPNAQEIIRLLRRSLGTSVKLMAVWHGATTQFHFPAELVGFTELLALRQQGELDALACVKPEMHVLSEYIFPSTLLNLPPRVEPAPRPAQRPTRAALIPMPGNWWKNFYTNVLVAAANPTLERVYVTAGFEKRQALPLRNQVINVGRLQRAQLFQFFREVDVLLNVTLTECQPMTALEGLAFGVPCLTGPLSLGTLDSHPYQRLVQVAGTGSLLEIQTALERLLGMRASASEELWEMMQDYTRALHVQAVDRYLEFTQL